MKKVERISVASFSFVIDQDAHELLTQYIGSLAHKYGTYKENELVQDIENRIAEIFSEKINTPNHVITIEMVRAMIVQIGTVSSIELDSFDTESGVRFNFEPKPKRRSDTEVVQLIGDVAKTVGSVCTRIGRFLIYLLMVFLGAGVIACIATSIWKYHELLGVLEWCYVEIEHFILFSFPLAGIFFIIAVMAMLYRIVDRAKHSFSKWITISIFLGLGIISSAVIGLYALDLYSINRVQKKDIETEYISIEEGKNITVEIDNQFEENSTEDQIVRSKEDGMVFIGNYVYLYKDNSLDKIKVVFTRKSNGKFHGDAFKRMNRIENPIKIEENRIYINNRVKIPFFDFIYHPYTKVDIYYPEDKVKVTKKYINDL